MDCPHCQLSLTPKDYEHISVSFCKNCGGIWLDPSQLSQIITLRDDKFSENEIQNTLKSAHPGLPSETSTLPCPVCSTPMQEMNYDYSSGVLINSCSKGHGLWFDKDELEHVEIFMEHWDDEEKIHQADLLAKLQKVRNDLATTPTEDETYSRNLSKKSLFDRIFLLFDSLRNK